jgi:ribosomal protein L35
LTSKNRKRSRRLRDNDMVDKTNAKQIKALIPYK